MVAIDVEDTGCVELAGVASRSELTLRPMQVRDERRVPSRWQALYAFCSGEPFCVRSLPLRSWRCLLIAPRLAGTELVSECPVRSFALAPSSRADLSPLPSLRNHHSSPQRPTRSHLDPRPRQHLHHPPTTRIPLPPRPRLSFRLPRTPFLPPPHHLRGTHQPLRHNRCSAISDAYAREGRVRLFEGRRGAERGDAVGEHTGWEAEGGRRAGGRGREAGDWDGGGKGVAHALS